MSQSLTNPIRNHEVAGLIPSLAQWVKDPALPELWCRSQTQVGSWVAVALAQAGGYSTDSTLSREPPYAAGVAPEMAKRQKKKKKKEKKCMHLEQFGCRRTTYFKCHTGAVKVEQLFSLTGRRWQPESFQFWVCKLLTAVWAAMTKYHSGWWCKQKFISHSSRRWEV